MMNVWFRCLLLIDLVAANTCFSVDVEPHQIDAFRLFVPIPAIIKIQGSNLFAVKFVHSSSFKMPFEPFVARLDGRSLSIAFAQNISEFDRQFLRNPKCQPDATTAPTPHRTMPWAPAAQPTAKIIPTGGPHATRPISKGSQKEGDFCGLDETGFKKYIRCGTCTASPKPAQCALGRYPVDSEWSSSSIAIVVALVVCIALVCLTLAVDLHRRRRERRQSALLSMMMTTGVGVTTALIASSSKINAIYSGQLWLQRPGNAPLRTDFSHVQHVLTVFMPPHTATIELAMIAGSDVRVDSSIRSVVTADVAQNCFGVTNPILDCADFCVPWSENSEWGSCSCTIGERRFKGEASDVFERCSLFVEDLSFESRQSVVTTSAPTTAVTRSPAPTSIHALPLQLCHSLRKSSDKCGSNGFESETHAGQCVCDAGWAGARCTVAEKPKTFHLPALKPIAIITLSFASIPPLCQFGMSSSVAAKQFVMSLDSSTNGVRVQLKQKSLDSAEQRAVRDVAPARICLQLDDRYELAATEALCADVHRRLPIVSIVSSDRSTPACRRPGERLMCGNVTNVIGAHYLSVHLQRTVREAPSTTTAESAVVAAPARAVIQTDDVAQRVDESNLTPTSVDIAIIVLGVGAAVATCLACVYAFCVWRQNESVVEAYAGDTSTALDVFDTASEGDEH